MALTVVMTVSAFAEWAAAQQTGLFPLAPIRRQRVPCDQEDPVYRLYKEQYFGYHPTMWRRFPDGWGAPSPEAPNRAASFAAIPLQPPEDMGQGFQDENGEFGEAPNGMGGAPPQGVKPELPAPPAERDRSPFELEQPNEAPANPNGAPAPRQPAGEPSPFEQLNPRAGATRPDDLELPPPAAARNIQSNNRRLDRNVAEAGRPLLSMDAPPTRVNDRWAGLEDMSGALDAQPANPRPATTTAQPAPSRRRVAATVDAPRWNAVRR